MVLPLSHLNSIGYDNKPDNAWEDYHYTQAFPEESSLQRGGNVPFYRGPVLQRGYGLGSIFKSVARSAVIERNSKICLDYWFGSIARCGKGREYQNSGKETSERNSLAFLDDTVSGMSPRKSIKGTTNKQIAISSSKPNKRKHQSGELNDTIFSKSKKERN